MKSPSIFINPLTDFGFKYIFGQDSNKEFTISFLNSLFPEDGKIVDLTYIDKESVGDNKSDRGYIYDIHCTTESGKTFIVEMQNRYQAYFKDRALYYMAGDFYHQAQKGKEWDYCLTPVYGVFLMNFDWKEESNEQIIEEIGLTNIRTHEVFSDKLKMKFLRLPLMKKTEEECKKTLERWLYILKNMENMERIPTSFTQEPIFGRLGNVARVANLSETERRAYDRSLKTYWDNYAVESAQESRAQIQYEKGMAKGLEKGIRQGRNEGIKQGIEKGRNEGVKAVAKSMMQKGFDIDTIASLTGLSIEDLKML